MVMLQMCEELINIVLFYEVTESYKVNGSREF